MIQFTKDSNQDRGEHFTRIRNPDELRLVAGRIQRVNYQKCEFTMIAEGRVWSFALSAESKLWFDGRLAPFRCFQPLDQVQVVYKPRGSGEAALALKLWAEQPGQVGEAR